MTSNNQVPVTQVKGTFSMDFSKYRQVPANLQDDVFARRKAEKEERLAMA